MGDQRGRVTDSGWRRRQSCLASDQSNYPNFCRLILSPPSAQDRLRIPGKFVKKLGKELPNVATLITPNGCVCHVRLEKIDGKFCFTEGWYEFVKHQSIGGEFLLIFTYIGNSILRVNIYNIGNAEINYQCNTHRGPTCGYQVPVKADYRSGLLYRLAGRQAPRHKENKEADSVCETNVNRARGHKPHSYKNLDKAVPVPCVQCGCRESSSGCREPIEEEVQHDDGVGISDLPPPCPTRKTCGRKEANKEADSVCETNVKSARGHKPHIYKNLDKAPVPCVQCGCRESSCGCREPIEEEVQDDDGVGISDPPPPCPTPKSRERKEANNVFRKTANAKGARISYSGLPLSHLGKEVLLSELMTSETRLNQETRKRKIEECDDSAKKRVSKSPPPGTETSLRRSRAVKPQEKAKVINLARMFRSEKPFCRVLLRPSYTYKGNSLHLPSSFADRYLNGVSKFITISVSTGEKWPIRCTWLENGTAKLTSGWHQFVMDNKLEEGDVCVFELIKTSHIVLKVTIYRVSWVSQNAEQPVSEREKINETMQNTEQYVLPGRKKTNEATQSSEPANRVTTRSRAAKLAFDSELNG